MADDLQKQWADSYNPAPSTDTTSPTESTSQTPITDGQPQGKLDRQQIEEKVAKDSGQEGSKSFGDYAWDGAVGVAAGVEGFGKSLGRLTNNLAGTVGLDFADDHDFDSSIHTHTWVGGLTSGITQFALGFIPALGIAGKIGGAVGITSKLVTSLAAGAAADFAGFDGQQQRLSNLVEQHPALSNPITAFLAAKPDDNWAEGRLKGALEGLGLGLAMHPLMEGLKAMKGIAAAKMAGNAEAAEKILQESAPKINAAMQKLQQAGAAGEAGAETAAPAKVSSFATNGVPSDLVDKVVDHLKSAPNMTGQTLDEAVQTHLNFDKNWTGKTTEGITKFAMNVSDRLIQEMDTGKMSNVMLKDVADQQAEIYGGNPKQMFSDMARDASVAKELPKQMLSYRIMRNAQATQLYYAAQRYAESGEPGELANLKGWAQDYMSTLTQTNDIQKGAARTVQSGNIGADGLVGGMDPKAFEARYKQTIGNIVDGKYGQATTKKFAAMLAATQGDPKSLMLYVNSMAETGARKVGDVINELHTNAILWSIPTMATKFIGDMSNAVMLPMERILGGAWQQNAATMKSGANLFTNVVTSFLDWTHLFESAKDVPDHVGSGLGSAFKAFNSGHAILDHLSEFEQHGRAISPENFGMKDGSMLANAVKYAGNVINMPAKLLVGMDQLWKSANYKGFVREEGTRLATEAGLSGNEYAQFVRDHITKAFGPEGEALNDGGKAYAASATFSDDLTGGIGKWVQNGVNSHPLLRLIMPFVKTPTNIFRRAWQMTPGLNLLQNQYRQMAMSADPLVRAQAYGRATLGGMLWTTAIGMTAAGKITGGGPGNSADRKALMESGWQPYSVVTTDANGKKSYISFKKMEPFAYALSLAADWHDAAGQMHDDDSASMGSAMAYAMAHNLESKTYLTGLSQLVNALSKPDEASSNYFSNMAASFLPQQGAKQDDYMRETRTMMDALMRKIPGLSSTLPPQRDMFGQAVKTPGGYLPFGAEGSWLARQVSPFAYSQGTDDKTKQALSDLQYGFKKAPDGQSGLSGFKLSHFTNPESGQDAYDRFQELHGQVKVGGQSMAEALKGLVNSQRYADMPKPEQHGDELNPRVRAVNNIIAQYRGHALRQTLEEYPNIGKSIAMFRQQQKAATTPSPVMAALGQ